jgi:hypothetical protein
MRVVETLAHPLRANMAAAAVNRSAFLFIVMILFISVISIDSKKKYNKTFTQVTPLRYKPAF